MTLFPYRAHLEEEVEYLKSQLAQRDRVIDELQRPLRQLAGAIALNKPVARPKPAVVIPVAARGWDAYRARQRETAQDEPQEAAKENDGEKSE